MYKFVDQPCDRLTAGSRFILEAMRGWVMSAQQNRCPVVTLAPSFSRMAADRVLGDFHALMLDLHRQGRISMAFGPIGHDRITEIEAVLLSLWSEIVADCPDRTRIILELLVTEQAIDRMMAHMVRIAAHMSTLGLAPSGLLHAHEQQSGGIRPTR